MYRVFACLGGEHDWRLVVLAGVFCLLASLVAISLFQRARASRQRVLLPWLLLAGAAAGCGMWATHFIAMLAYEPGVAVAYDIELTILSLFATAVVTTAGLIVAAKVPRWTAPAGGCPPTTYGIEAGSTPGASNLANILTGTSATSFTASSVPSGTYYVRVRAGNGSAVGGVSSDVTVVVGGTAVNVTGRWVGLGRMLPLARGGPIRGVTHAASASTFGGDGPRRAPG